MNRVIPLPGCGRRAAITDHALERWLERVRWVDDQAQALEQFERLVELGEFSEQPPAWWPLEHDVATLTYGFVIAGDVCFVICRKRDERDSGRLVVVSVACRGDLPEQERTQRHHRSRQRRYRTRLRARKAGGTRGPRGPERRRRRDELERDTDSRRWAA